VFWGHILEDATSRLRAARSHTSVGPTNGLTGRIFWTNHLVRETDQWISGIPQRSIHYRDEVFKSFRANLLIIYLSLYNFYVYF